MNIFTKNLHLHSSHTMTLKHLLFTFFIAACGSIATAAVFNPVPRPNPWVDDYTPVSSLENYRSWGTYNVHDPSCIKAGEYYYMYSTDAIYFNPANRHRSHEHNPGVKTGFIQVRRSRDLVNWEYAGWAFDEIPAEAADWVKSHNNRLGASNIWAPYITRHGDRYRLYYCVSAFGKNTSYIGLAESISPDGPWEQRGCVVKTDRSSAMNAIDPSVITDTDGRMWMHYGSYFGGLYCVELDPSTGLTKTDGDKGHLTARRANWRIDNLEAPEIFYYKSLDKYFLFASYEPLMTTYNVRVCRSDNAAGPFTDFYGQEMRDTTNNFPILTAPYAFDRHAGWAGTGHCGVFDDGNGRVFMVHQARLAPSNELMDLHLRRVFFTPGGWPVVSPQRYAGNSDRRFNTDDIPGVWELIRIDDPRSTRGLEAGQVLWGEGHLMKNESNGSIVCAVYPDGFLTAGLDNGSWTFDPGTQLMTITLGNETITDLIVHAGHDWERQTDTVLLTGLDSRGRSVWAKRIR